MCVTPSQAFVTPSQAFVVTHIHPSAIDTLLGMLRYRLSGWWKAILKHLDLSALLGSLHAASNQSSGLTVLSATYVATCNSVAFNVATLCMESLHNPMGCWTYVTYCDGMLPWCKIDVFVCVHQVYGTAVVSRLDRRRKMITQCFFRQHCTMDLNGYTKDLTLVSPDLSKVLILDNSPGAYRSNPG